MTLQQSIQIGLDNSEIVRVIAFGAQGIPIGGFEPTPLNTGASAGVASSLGAGTLQSVYDPAILETQIATALASFDTAFTTSVLWGSNITPFNNGVQGGSLSLTGTKFPIVSVNDSATWQMGLSKTTETGAQLGIVHNVAWSYQNSSFLVWPSAYTTNIQLTLTQPLLGSAPLPNQAAPRPVGLEANRATIVIQRLNADAAVWRFKAEVMAHVRSVEQQYWNLAQAHVQLWSRRPGRQPGREILNREQAALVVGRGTIADVAEAAQRLEQFNLDLVTRTSDVITTERQLRNILGLPPADNRRIIPVTPPTEARLEPDWETSLAQMINFQPDIVQQQLLVRVAELQLLIARNQLLPQLSLQALYQLNGLGQQLDSAEAVMTGATLKALNPVIANMQRAAGLNSNPGNYSNFVTWQVGFTFQAPLGMRAPLANTRQAQYALLRARAYLQQVVHQTTHSLARFFLEIDANFKQFKTASRLRAAAAIRLESSPRHVRGRPMDPGPLPGCRRHLRHRRRQRGPVQDDLQHLDRRSGRSQGNTARLRQYRRRRRRPPRQGLHPGPRHPGRPSPILDRSRRSPDSPAASRARSIPIPPTTTRRRVSIPPEAPSLPAPAGPLGPRPRPSPPTAPPRLLPESVAGDACSRLGPAGRLRRPTLRFDPTSGSPAELGRPALRPNAASLIDPASPAWAALPSPNRSGGPRRSPAVHHPRRLRATSHRPAR